MSFLYLVFDLMGFSKSKKVTNVSDQVSALVIYQVLNILFQVSEEGASEIRVLVSDSRSRLRPDSCPLVVGRSSKTRSVHHPSTSSPSRLAAPRCAPLPAWRGGSDGSARLGVVVLLFHPPQEGTDAVLPQPGALLVGLHVLPVHLGGASAWGCGAGGVGGCKFRGRLHPARLPPHQTRSWRRSAEQRGRPQHGDVLQPHARQRLLPQRGQAG